MPSCFQGPMSKLCQRKVQSFVAIIRQSLSRRGNGAKHAEANDAES